MGMAVGGVPGQFLPLRLVISGSIIAIGLVTLPMLTSHHLKNFFSME
jgi:hypothetical protein